MFEAYITNTALYPLMGIEVGTTVHFPITTQELQAALAKIGIDGKRYSEVFFTSFDSDVLGLYDYLYECENIDELNELGHALLEVRDKGGLETFEAALVLGNHTRSVKDLINTTGLAVALLAIHRGAKRRYIIAVLVALRPVNTACMAEQNHASERGAVIRMLRVAVGNLKLQHAASGNLDAGKRHRQAVHVLSEFLIAEIGIAHFGQFKVQRFVGGHGGGGCGISVHHRHKKSSCVWGSVRRLPC